MILNTAYHCEPLHAADLHQHLDFVDAQTSDSDAPPLSPTEKENAEIGWAMFELALKRYLNGMGHPNTAAVRSIVPEEEFECERSSLALRPLLFLNAISSRGCLDPDPSKKLTVRAREAFTCGRASSPNASRI